MAAVGLDEKFSKWYAEEVLPKAPAMGPFMTTNILDLMKKAWLKSGLDAYVEGYTDGEFNGYEQGYTEAVNFYEDDD